MTYIKIFSSFYQKWISKNKIKSADGWELKKNQHLGSPFAFGQRPKIWNSIEHSNMLVLQKKLWQLRFSFECPPWNLNLERTLLMIQRKSERRGLHPKTWGMNCQMLRRNYERCLFMGISSIIHIVFGPEHCLKLGASSKCANKLLGLLRKGVADMSPPIKIVLVPSMLVPSNNQPIISICRPNLGLTFSDRCILERLR